MLTFSPKATNKPNTKPTNKETTPPEIKPDSVSLFSTESSSEKEETLRMLEKLLNNELTPKPEKRPEQPNFKAETATYKDIQALLNYLQFGVTTLIEPATGLKTSSLMKVRDFLETLFMQLKLNEPNKCEILSTISIPEAPKGPRQTRDGNKDLGAIDPSFAENVKGTSNPVITATQFHTFDEFVLKGLVDIKNEVSNSIKTELAEEIQKIIDCKKEKVAKNDKNPPTLNLEKDYLFPITVNLKDTETKAWLHVNRLMFQEYGVHSFVAVMGVVHFEKPIEGHPVYGGAYDKKIDETLIGRSNSKFSKFIESPSSEVENLQNVVVSVRLEANYNGLETEKETPKGISCEPKLSNAYAVTQEQMVEQYSKSLAIFGKL
jgi:hypothetical protein